MASRRKLKKEIENLLSVYAADVLAVLHDSGYTVLEETDDLLTRGAELWDDTSARINETAKYKGKEVKAHYNKLMRDFGDAYAELKQDLNKVKKVSPE